MPTYDEYLYISECAQTIYLNGMLLLTVVYALTKYLKSTVTCYSIVSTLPLKWCSVSARHLLIMTLIIISILFFKERVELKT